jgi:hypothetical protein
VEGHVNTCPDCQLVLEAASRPPPPPPGPPAIPGFTLLNGGEPIGAGGMGEVFEASEDVFQPTPDEPPRLVAVKMIHRQFLGTPFWPDLRARFEREARLLGRMRHAGVPAVHRLGWIDKGREHPYLVMRLVDWPTLNDELRADWPPGGDGPGPDRLTLYLVWFTRVCETVGYAHDHRAVHLDLKPANVKVHPDGEVQVLDWGLGQGFMLPDAEVTRLFAPSSVQHAVRPGEGTAAYMSPEQARGDIGEPGTQPRMDVFALGGILCHILTGLAPYAGPTGQVVLDKAVRGDLADAHARLDRAAHRHPHLTALARSCLALEAADRPADAREVVGAVRKIILSAEEQLRSARWRFRLAGTAAALLLVALSAGVVALDARLEKAKAEVAREREGRDHDRQLSVAAAKAAHDVADEAAGLRTDHPVDRAAAGRRWEDVVRKLNEADRAAQKLPDDDPVRAEVAPALARLRSRAAQAVRDRAFLDALDVARLRKVYYPEADPRVRFTGGYFFSAGGADEYLAAFQAYHLPTIGPDGDLRARFAAAVRAVPDPLVRRRVVEALDETWQLDRSAPVAWLLDLADELDEEPVRKDVRRALRAGPAAARRLWEEKQNTSWADALSPAAALLLAAGLEGWADTWVAGPPQVEAAAAALAALAARSPSRPGWGSAAWEWYWVRLTLGCYLWYAAADRPREWEAAEKEFERAAVLLGRWPPVGTAADRPGGQDRAAVAALAAAAGGLQAHTAARRSGPDKVGLVLEAAVRDCPGFWPNRQLACLVYLDQGNDGEAEREARLWEESDPATRLGRVYRSLAAGLGTNDLTATWRQAREFLGADPPPFLAVQLEEIGFVADPARTQPPNRQVAGAEHAHRPGRDLLGILDGRVRADRALRVVARARGGPGRVDENRPAADIPRWAVRTIDPKTDPKRLEAADLEDQNLPAAAAERYEKLVNTLPWAAGPRFGLVRAQLTAGNPVSAAEQARLLLARAPTTRSRGALTEYYLATVHLAAAETADQPDRARSHRDEALRRLDQARGAGSWLAETADRATARAHGVARFCPPPLAEIPPHPAYGLCLCASASACLDEYGPTWCARRLAGRAFPSPEAGRALFAAAKTVPGAERPLGRAAVLVAWGYDTLPHDPALSVDFRRELLAGVLAAARALADRDPRALGELLDDPVVAAFRDDLGKPYAGGAALGFSEPEVRAWNQGWESLRRGSRLPR